MIQGRKFILEVPYDLIRWESQQVKALLGKSGIHWNTCDQQQYGANRRKLTCLIFNLEPQMLAPLFNKCDNKATGSKEKSTAQPFLGRWPRYRSYLLCCWPPRSTQEINQLLQWKMEASYLMCWS
jgi:hypothetical protein